MSALELVVLPLALALAYLAAHLVEQFASLPCDAPDQVERRHG